MICVLEILVDIASLLLETIKNMQEEEFIATSWTNDALTYQYIQESLSLRSPSAHRTSPRRARHRYPTPSETIVRPSLSKMKRMLIRGLWIFYCCAFLFVFQLRFSFPALHTDRGPHTVCRRS